VVILFKLALQILICLRLHGAWHIPLYYVFIPLWCVLGYLIVRIFFHLVEVAVGRPLLRFKKLIVIPKSTNITQ